MLALGQGGCVQQVSEGPATVALATSRSLEKMRVVQFSGVLRAGIQGMRI
jgi:hypothetical protein